VGCHLCRSCSKRKQLNVGVTVGGTNLLSNIKHVVPARELKKKKKGLKRARNGFPSPANSPTLAEKGTLGLEALPKTLPSAYLQRVIAYCLSCICSRYLPPLTPPMARSTHINKDKDEHTDEHTGRGFSLNISPSFPSLST
jgi:hypothetical protein